MSANDPRPVAEDRAARLAPRARGDASPLETGHAVAAVPLDTSSADPAAGQPSRRPGGPLSGLPLAVGRLGIAWRSGSSGILHAHLAGSAGASRTVCGRPGVDRHNMSQTAARSTCEVCARVLAKAASLVERSRERRSEPA